MSSEWISNSIQTSIESVWRRMPQKSIWDVAFSTESKIKDSQSLHAQNVQHEKRILCFICMTSVTAYISDDYYFLRLFTPRMRIMYIFPMETTIEKRLKFKKEKPRKRQLSAAVNVQIMSNLFICYHFLIIFHQSLVSAASGALPKQTGLLVFA